jgi:ABC-type sugar transport system permease subunit
MAQTEVLVGARPRARRVGRGANRDGPWAVLFLAPNLILFAVFMAYPVVFGLYMSLQDWKVLTPAEWVGFGNYIAFFQDPLTPKLLWNSLSYIVGATVPLIVLSLLCAVLLNKVVRAR